MARAQEARLVAAETHHARTGARRGRDCSLGAGQLAGDKKNAARQGATIVFLDETGFSERPSVRRTWAPRGQTPVLTHRFGHWRNLSAIGALAYSTHGLRARVYLMLFHGAVRSAELIRFLKHLHRHIRGPMILIWDGINPHRSVQTRAYLEQQQRWLTTLRLPAYAPELNPVEGLWSWFKGTVAANFCPESLGPLGHGLRLGRRRLVRQRDVLLGFLNKAGLFF